MADPVVTKILFVDNDETAFEFRKCMAKVLGQLPPMELFHATDATEALHLLEQVQPHVVIFDDYLPEERELFLDSLVGSHPQIVIQTDRAEASREKTFGNRKITYVNHADSLEAIHQTFVLAASLATGNTETPGKLHS